MKIKGRGRYLLTWIIASVLSGVFLSVTDRAGRSQGEILFAAVLYGFFLTAIIWAFGSAAKKMKEIKKDITTQRKQNIQKDSAVVPNNETVRKTISPVSAIIESQYLGNVNILDDVKSLLWVKRVDQQCESSLVDEPSLIDEGLEIRQGDANTVQDIGYYPSYRGLSPENRFIYLKWLRDVTAQIPIGFVFIFYYGLERHLLYGKYEEAFDMILKLQQYHKNGSFYAYSSDALLIAALYHKRADLINKIDLNKATNNLSQFVIAALTGRIDSDSLIANCKEVGFTNQRYIKNDYELFSQILSEILNEKFGCTYYPIEEADFLKCKGAFQLVLANYSLKLDDRFHNAPDIATNEEYKKNVFEILSATHEKVKAIKKIGRSKKN